MKKIFSSDTRTVITYKYSGKWGVKVTFKYLDFTFYKLQNDVWGSPLLPMHSV